MSTRTNEPAVVQALRALAKNGVLKLTLKPSAVRELVAYVAEDAERAGRREGPTPGSI